MTMNIESGTMKPTFWAKLELINPEAVFKKYTYVKGDVPTTRYAILFNLFTDCYRKSYSISLYDNIDECYGECDELDNLYKDHNLPIVTDEVVEVTNNHSYKTYKTQKIVKKFDFSNNRTWWGYVVLDFEKCLIVRVGGYGFYLKDYPNIRKLKGANSLEIRDYFFRNVDEVPDNYKWDGIEEYNGWLQFKWGNGKNAVDYVEPHKEKTTQPEEFGYDIETEGLYDCFANYEHDQLEEKFSDLISKETRKHLMEKFDW